jgi:RNA polymerase sigma-70 factor (ECF subfamily)
MSQPKDRRSSPPPIPVIPLTRAELDRLVVEHLPALLRFAERLAGDANIAEELVQEALCRVLQRWKSFNGRSAFKTWLLQIVVNVDRDRRRRDRNSDRLTPPVRSGSIDPSQQLAANELERQIWQAIRALPNRQQEIAVLTFGEKLSPAEVAELLETSPANVHTCLHLVRQRVATAIGMTYHSQK